MIDQDKSREVLVRELQELRQQFNQLKASNDEGTSLRKQAEEDLLECETHYQELMDRARDTIFTLSAQGLLSSVSKAFENLTGWYKQDWLGKPFAELLHPQDLPLATERFSNILKGIADQAVRVRIRKKSGGYADAEILASAQIRGGKPVGLVGIARDITERKLAETAMKASEQKYRELLEILQHGVWVINKENRTTYVNSHMSEMLGYTLDEMLSKPLSDFMDQQGEEIFEENMQRRQLGISEQLEFELIKRDGSRIAVIMKTTLIEDEKGNYAGSIAGMSDVTERRKAETALAEQNRLLSKLNQFSIELAALPLEEDLEAFITRGIKDLAGAKVAIFSEYNPENRTSSVSHAEIEPGLLEKVVSLIGNQLKNVRSLVSDEEYREMTSDYMRVWTALFEAAQGAIPRPVASAIQILLKADRFIGVVYMIEGRLYGSTLLAMRKGRPDPPMEILKSFIFLAASTLRRRQAEEKLRESESRFSLFMDHLPAIVFIKDNESRVLYANKSMDIALGASKWIGLRAMDIFESETAVRLNIDDKKAISEGYQKIEESFTNLDGKLHHYETQKFSIPRPGQDPLLGGIAIDITERKLAERELKAKNEELSTLNAEKDKFFSIIAHDLRSPFNTLLGFTRMMVEDLPTLTLDEIQMIAASMMTSATNLYRLLDNLLEWSRLQRGLISFEPETFVLMTKIGESMQLIIESANKKEIAIRYDIPAEMEVFADEQMLGSIIRNLVSNAVKFTPKGGAITLAAKAVAWEPVEISIRDTGIGMSKDILDQVFLLDDRKTRKGTEGEAGTGLGLVICRDLVEKQGGTIWVESKVGMGSTVYFTIPCKPEQSKLNQKVAT